MSDADCIAFLQWAMPQLQLYWPGFRKVRRQVCKRLKRRLRDLGLADITAYRARLEGDEAEWHVLDECCHITISRFFRDQAVFDTLRRQVLPDIATRAKREGRKPRIWSAGCASGEEPYSLKILWDLEVARSHPDVQLTLVATDVDAGMLARAREGCFKVTSLHELPPQLVEQAFDRIDARFCVKPWHRQGIDFRNQDLRPGLVEPSFDLILCRYVAFTYFALPLQERVLSRILDHLLPNGCLAIGSHERLPVKETPLTPLPGTPQIFAMKRVPMSDDRTSRGY